MTRTLTLEELDRHEVSVLEPRETLGWANWANVSATNLALAVNASTFKSSRTPGPRKPSSSSRADRHHGGFSPGEETPCTRCVR